MNEGKKGKYKRGDIQGVVSTVRGVSGCAFILPERASGQAHIQMGAWKSSCQGGQVRKW